MLTRREYETQIRIDLIDPNPALKEQKKRSFSMKNKTKTTNKKCEKMIVLLVIRQDQKNQSH